MSVEIASAYVSLIPSARGFGPALTRELNGAMRSAGTSASSEFGRTALAGFTNIGRRIGQTLGVGVLAAAGFGIKIAADFQQTSIAFEGMLGSAGAAKSMLEDLQKFASKTQFSFTGLSDVSRRLLAAGFAAEDLIPTLTTLGDATSFFGVGEDALRGVVRALGQMRGKGKASAEELQQISDAMVAFPVYETVAKSLGVTVPQLFKQLETGSVLAEPAIAALLQGMKDYPGAAGMMEKQNKTLAGQWSNFTDALKTAAINALTPWIPTLTEWLGKLSSFITTDLVPAFTKVSDWIRDHKELMKWFAVFVGTTLAVAFGAWAASVIAATWPIIAIGAVLTLLAFGLYYAYTNWGWFREGVKKAWAEIKILIGYIKDLIDWIGKIPSFLGIGGTNHFQQEIKDIKAAHAKSSTGWSGHSWGRAPRLPSGDKGGIWPGPKGVHSLGWVAGGETLIPTHNGTVGPAAGVTIVMPASADPLGRAMFEWFAKNIRTQHGGDVQVALSGG